MQTEAPENDLGMEKTKVDEILIEHLLAIEGNIIMRTNHKRKHTATEANTPNTRARAWNHHISFKLAHSIGKKQMESRDKKVIHACNATGYAISRISVMG